MQGTQSQDTRSKKKIIRIILAVLIFIVTCAAIDLAYMLLRVELGSSQWRLSDWLSQRAPDATAFETPVLPPTQAIDYSTPVVLPGLKPNRLGDVFSSREFTCLPVEIGISGYYQGKCSLETADSLMELYHFGRTETDIDLIDANFTHKGQGDDTQPAEFFQSIITSLGFSPEHQTDVLEWIEETLPEITEDRDIREVTFGETRYRLYGAAQNRSMEIGYLPQ